MAKPKTIKKWFVSGSAHGLSKLPFLTFQNQKHPKRQPIFKERCKIHDIVFTTLKHSDTDVLKIFSKRKQFSDLVSKINNFNPIPIKSSGKNGKAKRIA